MIVRIRQILRSEAGGLTPHNGEALIQALKEELNVTERVLARPSGQAIGPVIIGRRAQKRNSKDPTVHGHVCVARHSDYM